MSEETGQETAFKFLSLAGDDLWRRALAEFRKGGSTGDDPADDDETPTFDLEDETLTLELVKETLQIAEDAKARHDADKTRFAFRNRQYVLVHVFGRIVTGIDAFKGAIDKAVALDIGGQAALPWAGVKLVLGFLVNAREQKNAVAAGLATVTDVLTYYAKLEALYVRNKAPVPPVQGPGEPSRMLVDYLKDSIIAVYVRTLQFLGDAIGFYSQQPMPSEEVISERRTKYLAQL